MTQLDQAVAFMRERLDANAQSGEKVVRVYPEQLRLVLAALDKALRTDRLSGGVIEAARSVVRMYAEDGEPSPSATEALADALAAFEVCNALPSEKSTLISFGDGSREAFVPLVESELGEFGEPGKVWPLLNQRHLEVKPCIGCGELTTETMTVEYRVHTDSETPRILSPLTQTLPCCANCKTAVQ